jgi:hypothetical protein
MACYRSPHAAGCPAQAVAWGLVGSGQPSVGAGASGPPGTERWPQPWPVFAVRPQSAAPCLSCCLLDCSADMHKLPRTMQDPLSMPWDCELPGVFPYKGSEAALCPLTLAVLIVQPEGNE